MPRIPDLLREALSSHLKEIPWECLLRLEPCLHHRPHIPAGMQGTAGVGSAACIFKHFFAVPWFLHRGGIEWIPHVSEDLLRPCLCFLFLSWCFHAAVSSLSLTAKKT